MCKCDSLWVSLRQPCFHTILSVLLHFCAHTHTHTHTHTHSLIHSCTHKFLFLSYVVYYLLFKCSFWFMRVIVIPNNILYIYFLLPSFIFRYILWCYDFFHKLIFCFPDIHMIRKDVKSFWKQIWLYKTLKSSSCIVESVL